MKLLDNLKNRYNKRLETDFLPEALEIIEKPSSPIGHFAIWTTIAIIAATVIWSVVGKMDEVVIASAVIVPEDDMKVVQPLYEGTVIEILAGEGDSVTKGQRWIA